MTRLRRVCLVTDEIYPLTNGGIGRLLHNLIAESRRRKAPVEFHLMVPRRVPVTQSQLDAVFGPGVRLHGVTLTESGEGTFPDLDRGYYPPVSVFQDLIWQAQSHQIALELMDLERQNIVFDEIEFTDFRGQAFAAINEKRLGRGLRSTRLTVRIHSTFGAIRFFEPYPLSYRDLLVRELERKALLEADQVIAHLSAIAVFNRDFYDFDDDWLRRVRIEFPPVVDRPAAVSRPMPRESPGSLPGGTRPLVFASRSDPFKRPNLFVQAAAELMRRRPDYTGVAIFACHIYHPKEIQALLDSVPEDLRPRFQIQQISGEAREKLLAEAIVVIPSAYESLSLLAYEASSSGATLVLNEACLAFGSASQFVDAINCLKFDGSVSGLVGAFERALENPKLDSVHWTADPPYWEMPPAQDAAPIVEKSLISVVVTSRDAGLLLSETLDSLLGSTYENVEVVVVDDGSLAPLDVALLDRLQQGARGDAQLRVARHLTTRGAAAARDTGLRLATGKFVLFVEAGDLLQPTLLAESALALESRPELAGVLPTVTYVADGEDLASTRCGEFALQLGDAPTPGMVGSSSALHPVWRRSILPSGGFDAVPGGNGIWLVYFDALLSGARFIPTPTVGYLARQARAGQELVRQERATVLAHLASVPAGASRRGLWLASLLLELPQKRDARDDAPHASPETAIAPLRYKWVDLANRTLKRSGPAHGLLRKALDNVMRSSNGDGLPRSQSRPLRHHVADRLNAALKEIPLAHRLLRGLRTRQRS